MGNEKILDLTVKGLNDLLDGSSADIIELQRLYGLSREEAEQVLDALAIIQQRTAEGITGPTIQEARRSLDRMDYMWMTLNASTTAIYLASMRSAWSGGLIAAQGVAATVGQSLLPTSEIAVSMLKDYTLSLAGDVTQELSRRVRWEIVRGVLDNDSATAISKRVVGAGLDTKGTPFRKATTRAKSIIRTEITRNYNKAYYTSLNAQPWVEAWQFYYTGGPCTYNDCPPLNGMIWPKGSGGIRFPPLHTHCNCSLLAVTQQFGKYDI